jgi:hypothetical protein
MTLKEKVPTRSKIVTDDTLLEQANMFTYLGSKISYNREKRNLNISTFFANLGNSEQCF